jgi:hypothetical protein
MIENSKSESLQGSSYLLSLIKPKDEFPGVCIEDIMALPDTNLLWEVICGCLKSRDIKENIWGIYYLEALIKKDSCQTAKNIFLSSFEYFVSNNNFSVFSSAVDLAYLIRDSIPNYKNKMKEFLNSEDPYKVSKSLLYATSFIDFSEVNLLLKFKENRNYSETSMSGQLCFDIRNQANTAAREILKIDHKPLKRLYENMDGFNIWFYDWAPIIKTLKRWW